MNKTKYNTKNYCFIFQECDWAYSEIIKNGEDFRSVIEIKVIDNKNNEIASYLEEFKTEVNDGVMHNFINKFMRNANVREELLMTGKKHSRNLN